MLKLMMIKLQAKRSKRDRMWVTAADNNKMILSKVRSKSLDVWKLSRLSTSNFQHYDTGQ